MDQFIFCLEAVSDIEIIETTEVEKELENLALQHGISSIYKTCDTIEGLEESLSALLYDDHNFKNYEIIYFIHRHCRITPWILLITGTGSYEKG